MSDPDRETYINEGYRFYGCVYCGRVLEGALMEDEEGDMIFRFMHDDKPHPDIDYDEEMKPQ